MTSHEPTPSVPEEEYAPVEPPASEEPTWAGPEKIGPGPGSPPSDDATVGIDDGDFQIYQG